MALLILVKHSLPEIDRNVPASQWLLSDDGQRRCGALAAALEAYRPAAVVSSAEPKATETAQRLAAAWGMSYHVVPGLHEHRRETVGWLERPAFEAAVQNFFERPAERVFGEETAMDARQRFAAAVDAAITAHASQRVVIVAHGTVIALHAAAVAGLDGFALWQRLGLPSFVVLEPATGQVVQVVEALEA